MSMLTAALEQSLEMCCGETHEVLADLTAPPVCKEATQRALEILKTLFNITYSVHRQEVDEVNAAFLLAISLTPHDHGWVIPSVSHCLFCYIFNLFLTFLYYI